MSVTNTGLLSAGRSHLTTDASVSKPFTMVVRPHAKMAAVNPFNPKLIMQILPTIQEEND